MDLTKTIKEKYNKLKESLKETIFSKNKSIIRISEFSKKSTLKKILTVTSVNLFILIPYIIFLSAANNFASTIPLIITSFLFVFLLSNTLFFVGSKLITSFFSRFKQSKSETDLLLMKSTETLEVKSEYFEDSFIGKIKEFFMAVGSVATSFIPFIFFTNLILLFSISKIDTAFFSNPVNYLKIDGIILLFLTTLTTSSIYGLRLLSFIKKIILKSLNKEKNQENIVSPEESKQPKKSFPIEEFIPSLSKEFRKSNDINIYAEMKAPQDLKNHE